MEETAYFLDLVIKSDKPVVLVGSMRPATSTSADGPLNLYNAVARGGRPRRQGTRRPGGGPTTTSTRAATSRRPTPRTCRPSCRPSAASWARSTTARAATSTCPPRGTRRRASSPSTGYETLPRVDIVYAHENADGAMVRAAVAAGAKGIVLAGVGDGNATKDMIDALAEAAKKGVVVVRSSRVGSGIVRRNIELNDDAMGFVAAMELNAAEGPRPAPPRPHQDQGRRKRSSGCSWSTRPYTRKGATHADPCRRENGPQRGVDERSVQGLTLPEDPEVPGGVDRRTFLMRSAVVGAAVAITGVNMSAEEQAKKAAAAHRPRRHRPSPRTCRSSRTPRAP